jgi:hypothetical protein
MASIQLNKANFQPLQMPDYTQGIQFLVESYKKSQEEQRLKKAAIAQKKAEFSSGLEYLGNHQKQASQDIEEFEDYVTKLGTFERDANGEFLENKKKRGFGNGEPRYSDADMAEINAMAISLAKKHESWKIQDQRYITDEEKYKNGAPGQYDPEVYDIVARDTKAGVPYNQRSMLEAAPINPYEAIGKLDIRTEDEKAAATKTQLVGNTWVTTRAGLPSNVQKQIYYNEAKTNFPFQKGLVDMMMKNGGTYTEKVNYIQGVLMPQMSDADFDYEDPTNMRLMAEARGEAIRIANEYYNERKFNPRLIEAASYYDDQKYGLSKEIGKEIKTLNPDESLIRKRINDANKTANAPELSFQPRSVTFGGKKFNDYVDLSGFEPTYTTLTGFKLPDDAIKYIEKRDPETGKPLVVNTSSGSKVKGLSAIKTTTFPEKKFENNYRVAGWDKEANIIRLVPIVKESDEKDADEISQEGIAYFTIPYLGHESMVDDIYDKQAKRKGSAYEIRDANENEFD